MVDGTNAVLGVNYDYKIIDNGNQKEYFYKKSVLDYNSPMNEIVSYEIPERSSNILLCGYGYVSPGSFMEMDSFGDSFNNGHKASIILMDTSGDISWIIELGEASLADKYYDRCQTISYDEDRGDIMAVIEGHSPSLRSDSWSV